MLKLIHIVRLRNLDMKNKLIIIMLNYKDNNRYNIFIDINTLVIKLLYSSNVQDNNNK